MVVCDMPIKVKNGTITLPSKLRKAWESAEVSIAEDENSVVITRSVISSRSKRGINPWKEVSGMLKGRLSVDPVIWQRKIRKELDRKLPKIR